MSVDGKLAARARRRVERQVGEPVLMAFARWPYIEAVTPDDRHLLWDRQAGTVAEVAPAEVVHWTTCPLSASRS